MKIGAFRDTLPSGQGIRVRGNKDAFSGSRIAPDSRRRQGLLSEEELALPLACWIARRGGEIGYLEPVVDGAAHLANRLMRPSELEQLYGLLTEIVDAVDPRFSQHTASADPSRP